MSGTNDQLGGTSPPGVPSNGPVGVFGTTPIARPATSGQTAGFSAGVGTQALSDSTYTGGLGATAYTAGDIVRYLKQYGLMPL